MRGIDESCHELHVCLTPTLSVQQWDCFDVNTTCNPFQTWWNFNFDGYRSWSSGVQYSSELHSGSTKEAVHREAYCCLWEEEGRADPLQRGSDLPEVEASSRKWSRCESMHTACVAKAMPIPGPPHRSWCVNSRLYILTICDYATHYLEAIAPSRTEAEKVAKEFDTLLQGWHSWRNTLWSRCLRLIR